MKLAFFDAKSYDKPFFNRYAEEQGIKIKYFETKLSEDTAPLARGFDGVCVFVNDTVSAPVIDILLSQGCNFIALRCAGFNNVDFGHLDGRIPVFNVPAYSPHSVAEHAMAMLLTSIRRIHKAYIRTRDFNFSLKGMTGFDLHGKTVGVVGTGKIGRCFIDICRGFGMRILANDKYPADISDVGYVDRETLFKESDIISLHCPLTEETYHMIDGAAISKMKKNAIVINVARGAVTDEQALADAIVEGRIGALGVDVYSKEPFGEDHPFYALRGRDNVCLTPHMAWGSAESRARCVGVMAENMETFFSGGSKNRIV